MGSEDGIAGGTLSAKEHKESFGERKKIFFKFLTDDTFVKTNQTFPWESPDG